MEVKIDWLSFTLPAKPIDSSRLDIQTINIRQSLKALSLFDDCAFTPAGSRKPFQIGLQAFDGCMVYAGHQNYILVELSGKGCAAIRPYLEEILKATSNRVTRLDIAVDMECNTTPETFVEHAELKRIRSRSILQSDKGTTVYVGSPKSDRFARVYRYAAPHPRSALLRCEMVFRGMQGRTIAECILDVGLPCAVAAASEMYGWKHPNWRINCLNVPTLPKLERSRTEDKRVRWLIEQVAPAFRAAVESGAISNPEEFIQEHFLK